MAEEETGSGPDAQVSVFQTLQADDPAQLGDYTLTARLGAGGMGKVYLSHTLAGRPVAIKAIRPELADDPDFRRRFRREVAAARRVHGLYTAPVIDSEIDATPLWLATAFVQGPTLSAAVSRHGTLPVSSALLLAAGVAEALEAVHGEGIVHRDLKASNVLLATDGPRVIDFGIARAVDATTLTNTGIAVGTPPFMSPEQALNKDVGPATDVFSLGQLVTYAAKGTPAFGEGQTYGVLYRIVHEEPDLADVPEPLLPLLNRCLTKDADKRPSPAEVIDLCRAASEGGMLQRTGNWLPAEVTADITRHQDMPQQLSRDCQLVGPAEVPDIAQPPAQTAPGSTDSPGSPASMLSAASPGLLGSPELNGDAADGTGTGTDSETGTGTESSFEAGTEAETGYAGPDANIGAGSPTSSPPPAPSGDRSDVGSASPPATEARPPVPQESAPPTPPENRAPESASFTYRAATAPSTPHDAVGTHTSGRWTSSGEPETRGERPTPAAGYDGQHSSVNSPQPARKPIRRRALLALAATALAGAGGTAAVIGLRDNGDAENPKNGTPKKITMKSTKPLTGNKGRVSVVAFSPDSKTLAAAGDDDETVILWNVETRERAETLADHKGGVSNMTFSPDGKTLATATGGAAILWNMRTRKHTKTPTGHKDDVMDVAFSSDGKTLATTDYESVFLWNMETRERAKPLVGHKHGVFEMAFSPDGKTLATTGIDGTVFLWDVETRELAETLTGHNRTVYDVMFSPDGKTLAIADYEDERFFLWNMETRERTKILTGHKDGVFDMAFSPDSKTLATIGDKDKRVILWDVETRERAEILTGHKADVLDVMFSPDGKTLATASEDKTVRLWQASGNARISAAQIEK